MSSHGKKAETSVDIKNMNESLIVKAKSKPQRAYMYSSIHCGIEGAYSSLQGL